MLFRFFRLLLLAVLLGATPLCGAAAQAIGHGSSQLIADQQKVLQGLTASTDAIEKKIGQSGDNDSALVDARVELEDLSRQALASALVFSPRLRAIDARLDVLGPPPAQGQPAEPALVASERDALVTEKAQINAVIAGAENLSVRVNALTDKVAKMRSDLFRSLLTKRYELSDALSSQAFVDAEAEFSSFYTAVSSWLSFAIRFKFQAMLAATLMALGAAAVLLIGGRRLFGRVFEADVSVSDPSYLSRLSVAFWSTLLPTLALGTFFAATYFFFDYYNVLRGDIGVFLRALMFVVTVVFAVYRMTNAALEPRKPHWRLIPVETGPARWLVGLATAMAIVIGINSFLSIVNDQMGAPLSLTIARSLGATVTVGVLLMLMATVRPFRTHDGQWRRWPAWMRTLAYLLGAFTIGAALLGYIGLALFVSFQVVIVGTLLITAYIGFLSARAIGEEGGFGSSSVGRWLAGRTNLESTTLDQLGLAVSVAINILIVMIFLPLLLLMWGFRPGDIETWAYSLATGITVGSVTISFTGILSGIVVFVVGYFLTRWFQGWLDDSVMARGRVDTGVRNSIRLMVGYAGVAIAALVGISAAGIDLSNLALVAGGLSLGVGFGLQNVVSNFVSGLILLAERPFKVGDWIVTGQTSGTVKRISVRATEIETFQRQSVIVPNSELINSAVGNWTHRNKLGRVEIPIGVAYASDARRVHAILLDIAAAHPMVLKNPEPFVLFSGFGDSALNFEVRVYLADINNTTVVQNDIRFSILEAFKREKIDIPFPQREVLVKAQHPAAQWPLDDEKMEMEFLEREQARAAAAEARAPKGRRKPRRPDPN